MNMMLGLQVQITFQIFHRLNYSRKLPDSMFAF